MNLDLENKHIVVSGGTGALGSAVVGLLLESGAHCWIPDIHPGAPKSGDPEGERVHVYHGVDLAKEDQARQFYAEPPSLWASIHVAGGFAMSDIADTSLDDFEKMWRMNTVSCFLSSREAVRRMRETGVGGRIINVAARPAVDPTGSMLAYTTSKAGVASITECLALELVGDDILVNAILPSMMDTPANRSAMPDADHATWPKTSDIAKTIAFLSSPANSVTSGALVPVYGKLL